MKPTPLQVIADLKKRLKTAEILCKQRARIQADVTEDQHSIACLRRNIEIVEEYSTMRRYEDNVDPSPVFFTMNPGEMPLIVSL